MAITKAKKVELVQGFSEKLASAQSVVFVKTRGLRVNDANELRKKLKLEGIGMTVTKKTLLKRALDAHKVTGDMPALDGEIAMVYGADLLAPARESYAFYKTHKDVFSILGGVFEGRYMNAAEMSAIATIPSRDTLLAQIIMLMQSPLSGFAVAVSEIAKQKESTQ